MGSEAGHDVNALRLALFEASQDILLIVKLATDDEPMRLLDVNAAACEQFGYTREELLALDPSQFDVEEYPVVSNVTGNGQPPAQRFQMTVLTKAGVRLSLDVVMSTTVRDLGECAFFSARPLVARSEAERDIHELRSFQSQADQVARVGSIRWVPKTGEIGWSEQVFRLAGMTPGEVVPSADKVFGLFEDDDVAVVRGALKEALRTGEGVFPYARVNTRDGVERVVRGRIHVEQDARTGMETVVAIAQDVTDERKALDALAASREKLAIAQSVARIGNVAWDMKKGEGTWSDELYRILGLEPGAIEPGLENYLQFVHPDDRSYVTDGILHMHKNRTGRQAEVRLVTADGKEKTVTATTELELDEAGEIAWQHTTVQDITERKRLEDLVREGQAFVEKFQEIAMVGGWSFDPETQRLEYSDPVYRMIGFTADDWDARVETFFERVVHPDDAGAVLSTWSAIAEQGLPDEVVYRVVQPGGAERLLVSRAEPVRDEYGRVKRIVGATWDITDIRANEEALRRSEERFDRAARGSSDGLWDWQDIAREPVWVSSRFEELLGLAPGTFPGDATSFWAMIHPDDQQVVGDAYVALEAGSAPYDIEVRMRCRDGVYRWFRVRGELGRSSTGQPLSMSGSILDIDDRKRDEAKLRSYQEQLRRLADGVSKAAEAERRRIGSELHDGTVQSLGLLRVKLGELRSVFDGKDSKRVFGEVFELVEGTIREARALLQDLSPPVLYELGFVPAVDWLTEHTATQYGLEWSVDWSGGGVEIDPEAEIALFQTVRELLANVGRHANARSVRVGLEADEEWLSVSIEDDGCGFDVNESLALPGETGGFGLFSIRERVRVLGGDVDIRSAPGEGTSVTLRARIGAPSAAHSGEGAPGAGA